MNKIVTFIAIILLSFSMSIHAQEQDIRKEYYPNGQVQYERIYVNGVKHGLAKSYHENRNLFLEVMYVDGKKQGET